MKLLLEWIRSPVRWFSLTVLIGGLGAFWIGISAVPPSATSGGVIPSPREGFAAPDFRLESLEGEQVALSGLRGRPVVINLWASWCPPCRAEMPALQSAYLAKGDHGLEILAVNTTYQDRQADVRGFVGQYELSFPILLDSTGEVARLYQLQALPSTFFVDSRGIILQVVIGGPMSEATIRSAVQQILEGK